MQLARVACSVVQFGPFHLVNIQFWTMLISYLHKFEVKNLLSKKIETEIEREIVV